MTKFGSAFTKVVLHGTCKVVHHGTELDMDVHHGARLDKAVYHGTWMDKVEHYGTGPRLYHSDRPEP